MHIKHRIAKFAPLSLFATLSLLLTACPGVSGGGGGQQRRAANHQFYGQSNQRRVRYSGDAQLGDYR